MTLGVLSGVTANRQARTARRQVSVMEREAERMAEAQRFNIASERRAEVAQSLTGLTEPVAALGQQIAKQAQELRAAGLDPEGDQQYQQNVEQLNELVDIAKRQGMEAIELYNTAYPDRTINPVGYEAALTRAQQAAMTIGPPREAINEQVRLAERARAEGQAEGTAAGTPPDVQFITDEETGRTLGRRFDAQGNPVGEQFVAFQGTAPADDLSFTVDPTNQMAFTFNEKTGETTVRHYGSGAQTSLPAPDTVDARENAAFLHRMSKSANRIAEFLASGGVPSLRGLTQFTAAFPNEGDGLTVGGINALLRQHIGDPAARAYLNEMLNWAMINLRKESGATITFSELQNEFLNRIVHGGLTEQEANGRIQSMIEVMEGTEMQAYGMRFEQAGVPSQYSQFRQVEFGDPTQAIGVADVPAPDITEALLSDRNSINDKLDAIVRMTPERQQEVLNATPPADRPAMLELFKQAKKLKQQSLQQPQQGGAGRGAAQVTAEAGRQAIGNIVGTMVPGL